MFKYQNISKVEQTLTLTGDINPRTVKPDGEVVSSVPIENPNFKYIGDKEAAGQVIGTAPPSSDIITDAKLTNETNNQETN